MHKGPIVRINPDELHIRDSTWYQVLNAGPMSVRTVYALNDSHGSVRLIQPNKRNRYPPAAKMLGITEASMMYSKQSYTISDGLHHTIAFSTISHDVHRMRRAAIGSYFSKTRIMALEPFVQKRVELLCESLLQQSRDAPVEVHTLFLAFANDTVCSYAFDYSMNLLEDPQRARDWRTTISAIAGLTPLIKQFPWLIPVVKRMPRLYLERVVQRLARLLSLQAVSLANLGAVKSLVNV